MTGRQRILKEVKSRYGVEGLEVAEISLDVRRAIEWQLKLSGYPIHEIAYVAGVDESVVVKDLKVMRNKAAQVTNEEQVQELNSRMNKLTAQVEEGNIGIPQARVLIQAVLAQAKLLGMVDSNQLDQSFQNKLASVWAARQEGKS